MSEWIDHKPGDPCPCPGAEVEVQLRDNSIERTLAGRLSWGTAGELSIVRYRIIADNNCATVDVDPLSKTARPSALDVQVGGDHYKSCAIQPAEYNTHNGLGFLEGCVVKRVTRHDKSTGKGRQDIEKAIHELQLILELRYEN